MSVGELQEGGAENYSAMESYKQQWAGQPAEVSDSELLSRISAQGH